MKYLKPDYELNKFEKTRYKRIVGIDEVGRGCWAGPVYIGAFVFTKDTKPVDGVHDSKKLSKVQRAKTYQNLKDQDYKVYSGSVEQISSKGVGYVLKSILAKIVDEYSNEETLILIDGYFAFNFGPHVKMLKKGDMNYYSIAAASILAKFERDELMKSLALEYPEYGFENHKGYGTKFHQDAIFKKGISPLHRLSFKPIKNMTLQS